METDNYPCWPNSSSKLDDCPLVWKNFSSLNYIPAMLEDDPNIAIFNYIKTGFVSPPADYYLRPYMLALRNASSSCAAGFPPTEVITNFIKDFVQKMGKDFPYLLFSWMTSVSHDGFNSVQVIHCVHFTSLQRGINTCQSAIDIIISRPSMKPC